MTDQALVTDQAAYPTHPVAAVQQVLAAIHDPVRLEIVRRLYNAGAPLQCGALYDGINKSTATHHFKILREAGVTERLVVDGLAYQKLRREQVDAAIPGLLDSVVRSANWEAGVS
ncbi:ArsR/SmtB family transcription factor [Mycolicibacterium iranicum]|uniref:ArsR family transcriptional regulator n=1 Tax=Mycolicibacterium iranicum TaxID=912594 RepID=A0A1X1WMU6_MYCIR|nr:helix-turn-helix transcriptional regulator [Mycolicibacterium iranicum]MCZ0728663.1 helix-turn-helix transcriptional regulator [Mycolicibacterium iranicum]ORV87792.1 ArsR family transcriptional regulator [Mycolicibacterium iranicum]